MRVPHNNLNGNSRSAVLFVLFFPLFDADSPGPGALFLARYCAPLPLILSFN